MEKHLDKSNSFPRLKIKDPSLLFKNEPSKDERVKNTTAHPTTPSGSNKRFCSDSPDYEFDEIDIKVDISPSGDRIKEEPDTDGDLDHESDETDERKPNVNELLENTSDNNVLFTEVKEEKFTIDITEHALKEEIILNIHPKRNNSIEEIPVTASEQSSKESNSEINPTSPDVRIIEEPNIDYNEAPLIDLDSVEKPTSDTPSKTNLPSTSKISIVHPLVNAGISDTNELNPVLDVSTPVTILQYDEEVPTPEDANVHIISKATILPFWSVNKAIERTAASQEVVRKSIELKRQKNTLKPSKKKIKKVTVEEKKTSDVQSSNAVTVRPSPPVNAVMPLVNSSFGQISESVYVNYNIKNVNITIFSRSETYRGVLMIGDERYECIGKSNALLGGKHPLCIMTREGLDLDEMATLAEKYITPLLPKTGKNFTKLLIVCTIGWRDIIKTEEVEGGRIKVSPKYDINSLVDELYDKMVLTYNKIVGCLVNARAKVVFSHAWPVNIFLHEKHINNRSAVMLTNDEENELSSLTDMVLQKIKEFNYRMSINHYCVSTSVPFNKMNDPSVHWNTSFDSYNLRNGILPSFVDSELVHKRMVQLYEIYVRVIDNNAKFGCLYFIGDSQILNTFTHWNKSNAVVPYLIMSEHFTVKNIQETTMHYCKNDDIVVYTPSGSCIVKYKSFDGCDLHDSIKYPVVNESFSSNTFISMLISVVKCRDTNSVLNQIKLCIGSVIYVDLIEQSRTFIMNHFKTSKHSDADVKMKNILTSLNKVRNSFVSLNKYIEHACVIADIPFMNLNCENSNEITTNILDQVASYKFYSRHNAKHRISLKNKKPPIAIKFLNCMDLESSSGVSSEDGNEDSFLEWSSKRNETADKANGNSFSINPPDTFKVDAKPRSKSIATSHGTHFHRENRFAYGQHSDHTNVARFAEPSCDSRKRPRHCEDWSEIEYSRAKFQRSNEPEHYSYGGRNLGENYDRIDHNVHYPESRRHYPEESDIYQRSKDERLAKLVDSLAFLKQGDSSTSSKPQIDLTYDKTAKPSSINSRKILEDSLGSVNNLDILRKRNLSPNDQFLEPLPKRPVISSLESGSCSKDSHKNVESSCKDQSIATSSLDEAVGSKTASLSSFEYVQFPVDLDVNTEILKRISENTSIASCPSKQRTFNKLVTDFTVSREKFTNDPPSHNQYQNTIAKYVSYTYAQKAVKKPVVPWNQYWKNHLSFAMLEDFKNKVKELEQRVEVIEPKKIVSHLYTDTPAAIISELITMKDKLGVLSSVLPLIHTKMLHAQKNKKNPLDVITDSHMKVFKFLQTKLDKDCVTANALQRSLLTSCLESLSHLIYLVDVKRSARIGAVSALTYLVDSEPKLKEVIRSLAKIECEEDYKTVLHLVKKMHENMKITDTKEVKVDSKK